MLSVSIDTSSEKLRVSGAVMMGLGLFLGDSGTAVAALGLVAQATNNRELLQLFILFIPLAMLSDLVWLLSEHHRLLTWLSSLTLLVLKAGAGYFAWDHMSSTDGGSATDYQPFGQPDPFRSRFAQSAGYAPPVQPSPAQPAAAQPLPTPLPQTLPPQHATPAQPGQPGDLL